MAEYLVDLNATQAAIRAGYSKKTARFQASALLTNPNIEADSRPKLMNEAGMSDKLSVCVTILALFCVMAVTEISGTRADETIQSVPAFVV